MSSPDECLQNPCGTSSMRMSNTLNRDDALAALANEAAELRKEKEQLKQRIAELTARANWYEEQFRRCGVPTKRSEEIPRRRHQ